MPRLNQHFQHSGMSYLYFKCHLPPKTRVTPHSSSSFYFNEGVHPQLHRKIFLFIAVFYMLVPWRVSRQLGIKSALQACNWEHGWSDSLGCRHQPYGWECAECWQDNWNGQHAPSPLPFPGALQGVTMGLSKSRHCSRAEGRSIAALSGKLSCHFRSWLNALSSFRK